MLNLTFVSASILADPESATDDRWAVLATTPDSASKNQARRGLGLDRFAVPGLAGRPNLMTGTG